MNRTLLGVIVVVIVVVGAVLLMNQDASAPADNGNEMQNETTNPTPTPTPSANEGENPDQNTGEPQEPQEYQVSMTDSGYTPKDLTVKRGDTVTFINNGTKDIWPASAPHPSHTDYPAFDPKQGVAVGESWSFTFDRVGNWRFHDHLNPTRTGSVRVTE